MSLADSSTAVATIVLPTQYYQVFDLDFDRPVPSDGIGGWKTADLPLAVDHTALVVMHAWDVGRGRSFRDGTGSSSIFQEQNKFSKDRWPSYSGSPDPRR